MMGLLPRDLVDWLLGRLLFLELFGCLRFRAYVKLHTERKAVPVVGSLLRRRWLTVRQVASEGTVATVQNSSSLCLQASTLTPVILSISEARQIGRCSIKTNFRQHRDSIKPSHNQKRPIKLTARMT
jgi:hypothetical protein